MRFIRPKTFIDQPGYWEQSEESSIEFLLKCKLHIFVKRYFKKGILFDVMCIDKNFNGNFLNLNRKNGTIQDL